MSFEFPTMDPDPRDPGMPLVYQYVDNTTLQTMMHCWRHYWLSSVLGLRRKPAVGSGPGESVHLTFGSLVHDAADLYCKLTAHGMGSDEATAHALQHALDASWPEGAERDLFGGRYVEVWQCQDRTKSVKSKGVKRCEWSYKEHAVEIGHKCPTCGREVDRRIAYACDERYKNRMTLARAVVALCDHMAASSLQMARHPDGRIASELRWFQPLRLKGTDGNPVMVTGSLDSVATDGAGRHIVREYKTTRRQVDEKFWTGYEMSPQVRTYTWAAVREFGKGTQVHVYALHIGVNFVEVYVKPVYLDPPSLEEWQQEMEIYTQEAQVRAGIAKNLALQGADPMGAYPRNLAACNSLPGAATTPCPFRDFCRLSPVDRQSFLESNFHQEPWNPIGQKGALLEEPEA